MSFPGMLDALIVFVDARGFTSWAQRTDVFPFLDEFSLEFHKVLRKNFPDFWTKNLGDGAMLVKENDKKSVRKNNISLLKKTIVSINKAEKDFQSVCSILSENYGSSIPLSLGWGITKGWIKKLKSDYIGAEINKSSRLCGIARPFGIVIDKEDFPKLPKFPKSIQFQFFEQKRKLKGISNEVDVWVTKEIASQFLTRETIRHTPEVHIAGLCIKEKGNRIEALIAKRNKSRKLFPDLYEGCGGQLTESENFTTGVRRHYKLELNIDVEVIEDIHKFYYISQPPEPIIPGIKFLCRYSDGTPKSENHSELKWISETALKRMPEEAFIQGLKNDFLNFIKTYKNHRNK